MSRMSRNRDYSGIEVGGYHRTFNNDEPLWIRLVATALSGLIVAGVAIGFEKVGDSWAQRDDATEYNDESRAAAVSQANQVMAGRLGVIIDLATERGEKFDIPTLPDTETGLRGSFADLANASKPGGQASDQLDAAPFRFDLEWDGYGGKHNRNAPDEHCVELDIPEDTSALVAWQINDGRASMEVVGSDDSLHVKACQYGQDNVVQHHEVAIAALPSGSR